MIDSMDHDKNQQNSFETLNSSGFFPAPGESRESFQERIDYLETWSQKCKEETFKIPESSHSIEKEKRLSQEDLNKNSNKISELYQCRPTWVPAFYENKTLPMMTGGMAVHYKPEECPYWLTYFQLKEAFRHKAKWWIYSAGEIISHEMCHIARGMLNSIRYEETFAYQTSTSSLRRYLGGALLTPKDNLIFMASLLWLFVVDFSSYFVDVSMMQPMLIGKIPLALVLTLGLLRNANIRRELKQCKALLSDFFPENYNAVLFRFNDSEIMKCSRMNIEDFPNFWKNIDGFRGEFLRSVYPSDKL